MPNGVNEGSYFERLFLNICFNYFDLEFGLRIIDSFVIYAA